MKANKGFTTHLEVSISDMTFKVFLHQRPTFILFYLFQTANSIYYLHQSILFICYKKEIIYFPYFKLWNRFSFFLMENQSFLSRPSYSKQQALSVYLFLIFSIQNMFSGVRS